MHRALELAARGWGRVHPNPLVGAVLVRDGAVVGEGFHEEYGGPHAEVVAIREAGERARGATLYVTLEPCNHHGKTPPCSEAVAEAGIARVVYAVADPNPRAGGGSARLAALGVPAEAGPGSNDARRQNAAFLHVHATGRPFVCLKYALSLDAKLAERAGAPSAVTGAEALADAHRLRAGFDAILIGAGTAAADDPLLTVRGAVTPRVPPVRVVLDARLELAPDSRLARTVDTAPLWIFCAEHADARRSAALERVGATVLRIPSRADGRLPLDAVIDRMRADGVQSVLCEGGGHVGSDLLATDLVQRMYLYYAPKVFGPDGVAAFHSPVPERRFEAWDVVRFGADTRFVLDRLEG